METKDLLHLDLQYFADDNNQSDDNNDSNNNQDNQNQNDQSDDKNQSVKTYSEEEVQKMVKERVAREKKAAEKAVEEAKKLAKMNEDEKRKYEFEQIQKELDEYKRKDSFNGLSKEASKMLSEHQITADDELLAFVVKESAEDTRVAVNSFVSLINAKVEEGVKKALAGKPPKVNTNNKALTKQQIMDEKDAIKRQKLINENIHLFQK
ncbi:DUF4355 domain-containing protein [Bacillus sp. CH30_1T]|uniref:DUF4355 domain-containing protein n=1 Tax=Bacillus sp. CH30_1T TaxID=2604836 RepID=UPI0011F061B4|nr:DUF4355 domain-containing protein [Bacillus sp. CH30_1T]KAA0565335.1 DUF4355 domain-containing protein [Bacillus sp. CH30_1T]